MIISYDAEQLRCQDLARRETKLRENDLHTKMLRTAVNSDCNRCGAVVSNTQYLDGCQTESTLFGSEVN